MEDHYATAMEAAKVLLTALGEMQREKTRGWSMSSVMDRTRLEAARHGAITARYNLEAMADGERPETIHPVCPKSETHPTTKGE